MKKQTKLQLVPKNLAPNTTYWQPVFLQNLPHDDDNEIEIVSLSGKERETDRQKRQKRGREETINLNCFTYQKAKVRFLNKEGTYLRRTQFLTTYPDTSIYAFIIKSAQFRIRNSSQINN